MAIGLTIGIAGAIGVSKLLASVLFQTGAQGSRTAGRDRLAADRRIHGRLPLAGAARDAARSGQRAEKRVTPIALPRDRGMHVSRRQDVIAVDADDEIVHVRVDLAEPVRHAWRHDDDIARSDVPALPALR